MTEEKVELSEQTPLKNDTDAPATEEATTEAGKTQPVPGEKKKWWFQKSAKKEATEGETAEKEADKDVEGGEGAPAAKQPRWWQRKPCCKAQSDGPSFGIDYARRDEQQLQTTIDLSFNDIFGEPDAVHSLNGVWRVTHSIFTAVRNFFYKLFTVILCVPAAIVFGVLFAFLSALAVFVVIPAGRLLAVPAGWILKIWGFLTRQILEPVFAGIGQLFAQIKIQRYGINNDPTALAN